MQNDTKRKDTEANDVGRRDTKMPRDFEAERRKMEKVEEGGEGKRSARRRRWEKAEYTEIGRG